MPKKFATQRVSAFFVNNTSTSAGSYYITSDQNDSNKLKIGHGNDIGKNVALTIDTNGLISGSFAGVFKGASSEGFDNGIKVTDFTIDWSKGSTQYVTVGDASMSAATLTASFLSFSPWTDYQLIYDIGLNNMEIYFNKSIYWPGGIRPSLSNAVGARDILTFTTDGDSNVYGVAQFNFSASVG